jgi:hypothetical protein
MISLPGRAGQAVALHCAEGTQVAAGATLLEIAAPLENRGPAGNRRIRAAPEAA